MRLHNAEYTRHKWIGEGLGHLTCALILICAKVLCSTRVEPEEYYAELQRLEEQCVKEMESGNTTRWRIFQSGKDLLKGLPSLRKKQEAAKKAMDKHCYNAVDKRLAVELAARARYRPAVSGEGTDKAAEAERIGRRMLLLEIDKLSRGYYKFRRESKQRQKGRILEYIQKEVPVRKLLHLFYAKHPELLPRVLSAFNTERMQKDCPEKKTSASEKTLQGDETLQELVQEYVQLLSEIVAAHTP